MIKSLNSFNRSLLLLLLLFSFSSVIKAQQFAFGPITEAEVGIRVNSVQNMFAHGDTLWIGPIMNSNIGNALNWRIPEQADSLITGRGRMFSIYGKGNEIFAGIATNVDQDGESVPTAMGFYRSSDGGSNWLWIQQPLDNENDTTFTYGGEIYSILPVIVPEQSPSYEVVFHNDLYFSANWASGILRSTDAGNTWERLIMPPTNVSDLVPGERYQFYSASGSGSQPSPQRDYDPRPNNSLSNNYLGYSVLIDQRGRLWAGTAGGLNISENALTANRDQIRWRHLTTSLNPGTIIGNWIISMEEDVAKEQIWMTNWATNQSEREGLIQVDLDLNTFRKHLIGERIFDLSINGDTVLAVGNNGLFVSTDYGASWINVKQITSPNSFIRSDARYQSTAVTSDGRIWVGTSDGIASTLDLIEWSITRTDIPLDGNSVYGEQKAVSSYPYPNPFSPKMHQLVRIKFEADAAANYELKIFDAALRQINSLSYSTNSQGTYEVVWDGTDEFGYEVPNGVYLYAIEGASQSLKGKIVVAQ